MATFKTFEDIEAWQRSRVLTKSIYKVTSQGTFARDLVYEIKSARLVSRSCPTSLRGSNEVVQESSSSSWRQLKDLRVKCGRSCMLPLIKVM